MKVIHVPEVQYPSGVRGYMTFDERNRLRITQDIIDADNQAYEDWKIFWQKIIGIEVDPQKNYDSPLVGGFPPFDFVWIGKNLYKREPESRYGETNLYTLYKGEKDAPEVLCDCGSFYFSLRYGSSELKARCMSCDVEGVVYSG